MKTTSDDELRLKPLKEKILGWKEEGYKVDELEKLMGSVGNNPNFCYECGKKIEGNHKFCSLCGAKLVRYL